MATTYYIHFGIDGSQAEAGSRVVKRSLDDVANSAEKATMTWKQFVASNMSEYMKLTGSHSAAMKKMGEDWQKYKASIESSSGSTQNAGRVITRSLADIANANNSTVGSVDRLNKALNDSAGAGINTQKVFDKMQLSTLGVERAVIRLAGAISMLELSKLVGDSMLFAAKVEMADKTLQVLANNMGLTAEAALKYRDALKEQNITTSAATIATSNFIRAGLPLERLNEMGKYAQGLATMATGVGKGFVSSSEALDRFSSAIVRMNSNMLHNLGLQTTTRLAVQLEKEERGELGNKISQQEKRMILFNAAMKEASTYNEVYAQSWGLAARYISSMQRPLEELKRLFGTLFQPELTAAAKWFYELIDGMGDSIRENAEYFNALKQSLWDLTKNLDNVARIGTAYLTFMAVDKVNAYIVALRASGTALQYQEAQYFKATLAAKQKIAVQQEELLKEQEKTALVVAGANAEAEAVALSAQSQLGKAVHTQENIRLKMMEVEVNGIAAKQAAEQLYIDRAIAQNQLLQAEGRLKKTAATQAATQAELQSINASIAQQAAWSPMMRNESALGSLRAQRIQLELELAKSQLTLEKNLLSLTLAEEKAVMTQEAYIAAQQRRVVIGQELAVVESELAAAQLRTAEASRVAALAQEQLNVANGIGAAKVATLASNFKTLGGALNSLFMIYMAFEVGKIFGEWLNKFEAVRKAGVWMVDVLIGSFITLKKVIEDTMDFNGIFASDAEKAALERRREERAKQYLLDITQHDAYIKEMYKDVETDPSKLPGSSAHIDKLIQKNIADKSVGEDPSVKYNADVDKYNQKQLEDWLQRKQKIEEADANNRIARFDREAKREIDAVRAQYDQLLITKMEYLDRSFAIENAANDKQIELARNKVKEAKNLLAEYNRDYDLAKVAESQSDTTSKGHNTIVEQVNNALKSIQEQQVHVAKLEGDLAKLTDEKISKEQKYGNDRLVNLREIHVQELSYKATLAEEYGLTSEALALRQEIERLTQPKTTTTNQALKDEIDALKKWQTEYKKKTQLEDLHDRTKGLLGYKSGEDYELKMIEKKYKREQQLILQNRTYTQLTMKERMEYLEAENSKDAEVANLKTKRQIEYMSMSADLINGLSGLINSSSREGFEAQKTMQIGATIVNTAAAIMNQMAGGDSYSAWARAAAAAAMGAIQIAKIASTEYGGGGASVGGVSAGFGSAGSNSSGAGTGSRIGAAYGSGTSEDSMSRAANAMENASLALNKVSNGLTDLTKMFEEGFGKLLAGGLSSPEYYTPSTNFSKQNQAIFNINKSRLFDFGGNPVELFTTMLSTVATAAGLGTLFGFGNSWYTKASGLNLGMQGGELNARQYIESQKDGGWFTSDKHRTDFINNPQVTSALNAYMGDIKETIIRSAMVMSTSANFGNANIDAMNIQTSGRTAEDIQKDLTGWFTKAADIMAQTVDGLKEFTFYGESAFDAIVRLATSLQGVNEKLELTTTILIGSTLEGANAAYKLSELMGGMDNFSETMDSYFSSMFNEAEQRSRETAQATRQSTAAFNEMNVTLPKSKEGFRNIVDSLDVTTEQGEQLFAALMSIAPTFATMIDNTKEFNKQLRDSNQNLRVRKLAADGYDNEAELLKLVYDQQAELQDYQEQGLDITELQIVQQKEYNRAVQDMTGTFKTSIETMGDTADKLKEKLSSAVSAQIKIMETLKTIIGGDNSTLSPEAKYAQAQAAFNSTAGRAKLGDVTALGSVSDLAQQLLAASRSYNASGAGYVSDYNNVTKVLAELGGLPTSTEITIDIAQKQLEQLTAIQTAIGEGNIDQLTYLKGILGENSGVAELLKQYLGADQAAKDSVTQAQQAALAAAAFEKQKGLDRIAARNTYDSTLSDISTKAAWATTGSDLALKMGVGLLPQDLQYDVGPYRDGKSQPDGRVTSLDAFVLLQMKPGGMIYNEWVRAAEDALAASLSTIDSRVMSYDVGSAGITNDQFARIHKGEKIIDPVASAYLDKYGIRITGGNSEETVAELRAMNVELQAQTKELQATVRVLQTGLTTLIEQGETTADNTATIAQKTRQAANQ